MNLAYERIDDCIRYDYQRYDPNPCNVNFHLHNEFEIYFLISGDVNYFVEKSMYPIKYGDVMITNNQEIHKPSFRNDHLYERISLQFAPHIVRSFNSPRLDLLGCFLNKPKGQHNKISLSSSQLKELLRLFSQFENLKNNAGYEILKLNYLIEVLVLLNLVFKDVNRLDPQTAMPDLLIALLDHIDMNLDKDLSLESLSAKFYVDRFYMGRVFKKHIGSNIHEYILFKRISKAKEILASGVSVTETCERCGFNDYSNFLKMFKRTVGISPGKYKSSLGTIL
ncbi:AraC family transcriptional regulator [Paenibacillus cremeus]|uniref:Helix-turn-helix domain-containing protein n=1 Tax=Paenibacillus cremeus TaxID=2163881 RepID=A0A559JZU1_9BACL|nr:AraC family transcriptional regulator [Paenibacillus cremeus]TVY05415.1 helix-turn-helix domain-containing protein [Paenibacillus cremeus]